MIKVFLLSFFFSLHVQAQMIPDTKKDHKFSELSFRYMKRYQNFRLISEIFVGERFQDRYEHHARLGFNYRLNPFMKLGFAYRVQKNVRNSDNWIKDLNNQWLWNENEKGYQSVLIPELIFRHLLLNRLRGELRFQYEYNASNNQQVLRTRPNLTYFWFNEGRIFANIYFQFEHHRPLNFANHSVSQRWYYLGFLYHLDSKNKLGFNLAEAQWVWNTSQNMTAKYPQTKYEVSDKAVVFGLNYIFTH